MRNLSHKNTKAQRGITVLLCLCVFVFFAAVRTRLHSLQPLPGEAIYLRNCSMCHGTTGRSDRTLPDFSDPKWRSAHDLSRVRTIITNGTGPMPSFGEFLSAAEIDEVSRYVFTLADRKSRPPSAQVEKRSFRVTVDRTSSGLSAMIFLELDDRAGSLSWHGERGRLRAVVQIVEDLYLQLFREPADNADPGVRQYRMTLSADSAGLRNLAGQLEISASDFGKAGDPQPALRRAEFGPYRVDVRVLKYEMLQLEPGKSPSFSNLWLIVRVTKTQRRH